MDSSLPPIYFYLPPDAWVEPIPLSVQALVGSHYQSAIASWILLTYLHLQESQFPCQLVDYFPDEGIVIAFRDSIPNCFKPSKKMLLVCLQAERGRHPFAQLHVIQNPQQASSQYTPRSDRYIFPGTSFHIKHWPQPSLIPRSLKRGDRFENIAFMGRRTNLAPELESEFWEDSIKALGLKWLVIENPDSWRDYSEIDAIVAIRSFDENIYPAKPASKLCNAWLAGVPAIVGCDSAFELEHQSNLDFLKVSTIEETVTAVHQLQKDAALRNAIVTNGFERSKEINSTAVVSQWCNFLLTIAVPAHQSWCQHSIVRRRLFLFGRNIGLKIKQKTGTLAN